MRPFHDRRDAGRVLGHRLAAYAGQDDVIVLALPRGGVVVGYEVARALHAPLDVLIVRKLGVPGHEELGFGAIASGGIRVVNRDLVRALRITDAMVEHVAGVESRELERRDRAYRGNRPPLEVRDRIVVLVDDGLATGATMLAAVQAMRKAGASSIIVAVPVASREACEAIRTYVDVCICLETPEPFAGVGAWYDDFTQTSDAEVRMLLAAPADRPTATGVHASTGKRADRRGFNTAPTSNMREE
jgi:predicted phosphoribosyltransferase